jgi:hypothetical protein
MTSAAFSQLSDIYQGAQGARQQLSVLCVISLTLMD